MNKGQEETILEAALPCVCVAAGRAFEASNVLEIKDDGGQAFGYLIGVQNNCNMSPEVWQAVEKLVEIMQRQPGMVRLPEVAE